MVDVSELLALARKGKDQWNQWSESNERALVDFTGVDFTLNDTRGIQFEGFVFPGDTLFERATLPANVRFVGAKFLGDTIFNSANFLGNTFFKGVKFSGSVHFRNVTFSGIANFDNAQFSGRAFFTQLVFSGMTSFEEAIFSDSATFAWAKFESDADFNGASIEKGIDFVRAKFSEPPDMLSAKNTELIVLNETQFSFGVVQSGSWRKFVRFLFGPFTAKIPVITRLRNLRGIAEKTHAVDAERDLFILERQAEQGIKWAAFWNIAVRWNKTCEVSIWKECLVFVEVIWRCFNAMASIALLQLYRAISNCGRSAVLPVLWLFSTNWIFQQLYKTQYSAYTDGTLVDEYTIKLLADFNRGSLIPFASTTRPAYQSAIDQLFSVNSTADMTVINIPIIFQRLALTQGIIDIVLIFLVGLAIRNHFRVK